MLIVIGLVFFVAESIYKKLTKENVCLQSALLIGVAQTLALIPGVSRSGSTICAGIFQGVLREKAARFSFLLGGATTFGAIVYGLLKMISGKMGVVSLDIVAIGILTSFISGMFAIGFLMRFLKNNSLVSFGVYRIVLGAIILFNVI